MVTLPALWLPIVLSAVFVFIAANVLWMALPFWHRSDYGKLSNEDTVLSDLGSAKSGQYVVPMVNWNKLPAEERDAIRAKPMAFVILRNPAASFSFPAALISYFIYALVISTLVAYVTCHALGSGVHYLAVFRIAGTAAILGYAFGSVPDSIWYGKPWSVTVKNIIDGIIYGLLTAGTFGWLWPR